MNENLKEIILPIETNPAIVSRNIHAIHLSIIQKCDEQGINYVYNNYIQLMFIKESDGHITFDYTFPRYKNLSTFRICSVDKTTKCKFKNKNSYDTKLPASEFRLRVGYQNINGLHIRHEICGAFAEL